MKSFRVVAALTAILVLVPTCATAACPAMQRLAQEHSNDMARRDQLDHAGFASRAKRGAKAENVAYGFNTLQSKAEVIALWAASPRHAANMALPGCKGIASAVSRSGRRYWTMEISR